MSKGLLLIASFVVMLCDGAVFAQSTERHLSIEEMFAMADQNSKTIKAQRAAVEVAHQGVREAQAGRLPDIDLSLSASYLGNGHLTDRNFSDGQNIPMPHFGNNFAVEASQLVYGGGVVDSSIALAKLQHEMATVGLEASRSGVHFALVGYYLELYKLNNLIEVYEQNIALAKKIIAEVESRNAQGVALLNDVTRYKLRLKNLELMKIKLQNSADIINSELVTLLDMDADTIIVPDSKVLEQTPPRDGVAWWQEQALSNAYSLRQGSLAVRVSLQQERLAKADRLPKVALFAGNHFDGPITIEVPVIDKNFNYWYVGVGVSFKLSSLYKSNRTIKRAALATSHQQRELEQMHDKVSLAVNADYVRYEEAYDVVATTEQSVELATQNYDVVNTRYANGIALVTDMIDAANELLNAELQLVNARINIIFSYYKLCHTSGNI